jgi:hypothetical protein
MMSNRSLRPYRSTPLISAKCISRLLISGIAATLTSFTASAIAEDQAES